MAEFVPGRELCRAFYEEVVAPLVGVPHAAGLLGSGSDVLGYDTERSTDHDWGPRCTVLLDVGPVDEVRHAVLAWLPETYRGWPVRIGRAGTTYEPHVNVATLPDWMHSEFGWDVMARELEAIDWLLLPQQRLLALSNAEVFADASGTLSRLRSALAWYPDDPWWWLMACQWRRLAQEEAFVQRTAEAGDFLGSQVVAARQVRDCMRLALLVARRYAPYSKWLGTAFVHLPDAEGLGARLSSAVGARDLGLRETSLGEAYTILARRFNALARELDVDPTLRPFHDRPALVLDADRFVAAALARVGDRALAAMPLVGSVDQLLDSTDALTAPATLAGLRAFYLSILPEGGEARRQASGPSPSF